MAVNEAAYEAQLAQAKRRQLGLDRQAVSITPEVNAVMHGKLGRHDSDHDHSGAAFVGALHATDGEKSPSSEPNSSYIRAAAHQLQWIASYIERYPRPSIVAERLHEMQVLVNVLAAKE